MSINIPTAHKANVVLAHGQLQPMLEWCERNCSSEWKYMENPNDQWNSWEFFFESDRDYTAFMIWKK